MNARPVKTNIVICMISLKENILIKHFQVYHQYGETVIN